MAVKGWSAAELRDSVLAYMLMEHKEQNGEKISKTAIYKKLSLTPPRSPKSFEYRMQNISSIWVSLGRQYVKGLKPAGNVGRKMEQRIIKIVQEIDRELANEQERTAA